jgi:hypothetical protein
MRDAARRTVGVFSDFITQYEVKMENMVLRGVKY